MSMLIAEIERYLARSVSIIGRIIGIAFFIRFFILSPGVAIGRSMEPNFNNGHAFLVLKFPYFFSSPKRFDVVQWLNTEGHAVYIKRVIGLPGEHLTIKRNQVCIQDISKKETCLDEPYLAPETVTRVTRGQPFSWDIPPSTYFLIGDNRFVSIDSRNFGPIHQSSIIGKVLEW